MKDTISRTQLAALLWAGALAPAAELLPALTLPAAGKGAWLAPAAAIPLVLLSGALLGSLAGEQGLASALRSRLGAAGTLTLLLYIVWGELLLALRLRLCAQRLLAVGQREGALWFFVLAVATMTLWIGLGKLAAFARAGQLFLAILLTTGAVVLLLSLSHVRLERVLPLWSGDLGPALASALPAAGALGWGIWGAFLTGRLEPGRSGGRWLAWGTGGCLLLTLAQFVILGNLGPALAARLDDPFFTLAKSVGVEGAFQRVESVVAALWTLADLSMAALLLFALRFSAAALAPKAQERRVAAGALVLAAGLALCFFTERRAEEWSRVLLPWGNLLLGVGLPALLKLWLLLCEKGHRRGTSCGEKPG